MDASAPSIEHEPGSIAIVGMAGRFPAARSPDELWRLLREGREATQWLAPDALRAAGVTEADLQDPAYVPASLVLPGMEEFDAEFFGFSKRDAAVLDPQHRHFLECAWEALEDAGHMPEHFAGAIGVFGGCGMQAYLPYNLLTNPELVKSMGMFLLRHTGNDKDFLCSRVSYLLDLKGPSISVQTACSTSLVAVHVASQSLLSGECDMALAGGVSIELPHRRGYRYAEGEILSPDGHCRAFDDAASGTLFGSGAGIVVLRRLEDALRDGDHIHAVIRGSAVNNDGSQKAGYLAPSVDGQARAAVEALAVAGVPAHTVSYIEAHGTGTPVGDPIELAALTQAYAGAPPGSCGIGSLKTNIGHLDTAAGVASLIKVVLALRHGLLPASLNFSRPNTRIDMAATPFQVVASARPWPRGAAPRRAAVNSLGVGGTNAHVVVEEAPLPLAACAPEGDWQVLTLSARSAASLDRLKAKWLDFLAEPPQDFSLANAAFTTQVGRRAFSHRLAIAARDVEGLRAALASKNPAHAVTGQAGAGAPPVVLMFPGGGAHYPGAGRELLALPAFRRAVDECFAQWPADAPAGLRSLMFEREAVDDAAAAALARPAHAMPALFVLCYALARLWESWGVKPAAVIGHSAGEYVAACLAGVLTLPEALTVVTLRGQLFEAIPAGAMLSVDLPEADLREAMAGLALDVAAVNAPDLCIASGPVQAIEQLELRLAGRGVDARRVRIDVAAHSRLLDGVLERFRGRCAGLRLSAPRLRFMSTLTGAWADADLLCSPGYWVRHLRETVRFADGLQRLRADLPGCVLIEAGPGQGLCALARQNGHEARAALASTGKAHEPGGDLGVMMTSAAALWTRGAAPDWQAMRTGARPRRIPLPTYAFEPQRHWVEPGQAMGAGQPPALAPPSAPSRPLVPAFQRLSSLDAWFRVPQWAHAPSPADGASAAGHWLVFGNASGLSSGIAARAAAQGAQVTQVRVAAGYARRADDRFEIAAASDGDHLQLFRALEQAGRLPDRIVHLWSLDTIAGGAGRQLAGQGLAFDSLACMARAMQTLDLAHPIALTIVTAGAHAVMGEAVPHPERALALGPCRVIPRELPNVRARLVDLASADASSQAAAAAIVGEAQADDDADLLAWRGSQRWRLALAPAAAPIEAPRQRLRGGGVYLITGGLGDIALNLATWLAAEHRARLVLVSRRTLPDKADWPALAASDSQAPDARLVRRLAALEHGGAQVLALRADVADRQAMARVISDCRSRFGTIHGVFHAAGVLDDAPLATKTADSVQRVLDPKVGGAQVLHELLPPGDLDFFAVFSSTSVYLGAAGQCDYVAANAFLDALAASRPDGLAVHWGIWGDRGMAARAYGVDAALTVTASPGHPLLGLQVDAENDGVLFEARYDADALWVLQEHAVAGRPVLPGTAYIEIACAAMAVLHPGAAVEIRSLSFEEAMVFEPGAVRTVRTQLRPTATGYDFVVRSRGRGDDRWLEHARAGVGVFTGRLSAAARASGAGWRSGETPQEKTVAFGPRWRNIDRMRLGGRSGIAELSLPQVFAPDLSAYLAHPALTDMAATFGLHLVSAAEREQHLFVPLSIERIRIVAPVPRTLVSRVERQGDRQERFAAFDVSLHTPDGAPIATFEGFSLRGIPPAAMAQRAAARREPTLTETLLACGIRGEDAPALFQRIFSSPARDIVVSSIDLDALAGAMAQGPAPGERKAATMPARSGAVASPVEQAIAAVWRELLGVDEVAGDDDFFALGGHSLAAVRLFARIRKQFAVDLPLATLFQTPTLGALAALVAHAAGLDHPPGESGTEAKRAASNVIPLLPRGWSPLVTICKGSADRAPLFCVHGAGGNVLNFKVISDRLGQDLPFYGLQAQGVDGRLAPLGSIEEMAAQYVDALRTVSPQGPYRLAGYSAGGVIALEMAQQFKRAGARIDLLAMIDTLSPSAARRKYSYLQKLWLMRHTSLRFLLEWPGRRLRGRQARAAYALALERLARGEPLPPELVEFHLFRNFIDAQARYEPAPYDGSLALFKATQAETEYLGAGDTLGWQAHVRGDIRVTRIAGSHFSMMTEPGVSQLVEALRHELDAPGGHPFTPRSHAA